MPLPLLAAAAANAATLFSYNRQNFLYNRGQRVQRAFTGLGYRMQQFQLYRQDIRDLAALTTVRMSHYHVVGALELGMCATLLGPARLPGDVPQWVLWHQLVALCAAFAFLVVSMWLATRAAVAAESFNVRLQTQWIRLPVPDDDLLDKALTKAEEFEGEGLSDMLRVPFLTTAMRRVFSGGATDLDDASPTAATTANGEAEVSGAAASGAAEPESGAGPVGLQMSISSLSALQLYQQLQRNWSCYDAYSRVCMSVGTYWLVLSMAYYEVGWTLCHQGKSLTAAVACVMFAGVVLLLVYVDLFAGWKKLLVSAALLFAGPLFVITGAVLELRGNAECTPWFALATDMVHALLVGWFWHEGSIVPGGKAELPIRFRGVVYLDIFGPIVEQLRGYLDTTGLGQHAWAESSDSDEEEEAAGASGLKPDEVQLQFAPQHSNAALQDSLVRARLRAAIDAGEAASSSAQRRRVLGDAVKAAEEAGISAEDGTLLEARCALAKATFPGDVRRLRRLLHDWRDGAVQRHLDEQQRLALWAACEEIDILWARLKHKALEAPGIPHSVSVETEGSANFIPTWTRISHDTGGYGDANDAYEYWVGTSKREGDSQCLCGGPPKGVRFEEFEDVRARCADLMARAEYFACEAAAEAAIQKPPTLGQCLAGVAGLCQDKNDEDKQQEPAAKKNRSRRRKGHHPVVAYRSMSRWLLATWLLGAVVHLASVRQVRDVLASVRAGGGLGRRLLAVDGESVSSVWPGRFFRARDLRCFEQSAAAPASASSAPQLGLVASNGFLVYRLANISGSAEAAVELTCPVPAHDSLVSANCDAHGDCRAVVAASTGLWWCWSGLTAPEGLHLASLPQGRASGAHAPLRHWAAADAELQTFFAAPVQGPIFQLRRTGSALLAVAELELPTKAPKIAEWLLLTVHQGEGTLVALAAPGPTALAWSLASGRYLGARLLDPGRGGSEGTAAWCPAAGGKLYRTEVLGTAGASGVKLQGRLAVPSFHGTSSSHAW